jgi:imidazolonepropionase-like amidohydrolase
MMWCLMLLCLGLAAVQPVGAASLAVRAGKVHTAAGPVLENAVILLVDGKIAAVGPDVAIPAGVPVIEAEVAIPGLIDMHSHLGVYSVPNVEENSDGNEMTNPVTPQVRALDSFNFDDPAIPAGRAGGVTTIVSLPGSGNVIGGTGVAVKLKDAPPQEMVLQEVCALKMAIEGNPVGVYGRRNQMPSTLMGVYHLARKAFLDAQEYRRKWEEYEKKKADDPDAVPPARDLGKDALVMALNREIPTHIHCATAAEIISCIRLAEEFGLRLSLAHCYWAYLVLDELKNHPDVHFNVGPPMFFNYFQDNLTFRNNPAILSNAGLEVSLQTDALGGGQQNLLHLARLCVRYGMDPRHALAAVTINAARGAALDHRIGSLETGKDADLVLLDGDPMEFMTRVRAVIIDGNVEWQEPEPPSPLKAERSSAPPAEITLPDTVDTAGAYAVRGGTILTMAGEPVTDGVMLVRDGKIQAVGADVAIPAGWPVVDARGGVVLPGLISPRSHLGIGNNWRRQSSVDETSKPVLPELEVRHAIEPQAPHFQYARELGITTVMVTPGDRNVMGGQAAVLKTDGAVVDHMIIRDRAAMMVGLGASAKRESSMPTTRMGVAALLRETLTKAKEYQAKAEREEAKKEKADSGDGGETPAPNEGDAEKRNGGEKAAPVKTDLAMEALLPVIRGETPVVIHAERRDDILTALRVADEFGLKVILDGATDAWQLTDELKARDIPVILEDLFRGIGQIEDRGFNAEAPALLAGAGIRFSFRARDGSFNVPPAAGPGGDPLEIAAFAVRNGLSEADALRAVTLDAARIIGVDDRVGSLEAGKDADFVILGGHPFRTASVPELVFIDGKLVFRRDTAERLTAPPARRVRQ